MLRAKWWQQNPRKLPFNSIFRLIISYVVLFLSKELGLHMYFPDKFWFFTVTTIQLSEVKKIFMYFKHYIFEGRQHKINAQYFCLFLSGEWERINKVSLIKQRFLYSYTNGGDDPRLPSLDPGLVFLLEDVPRRPLSRRLPPPRWLLGFELVEFVDSAGELDNWARLSLSAAVSPSVKLKSQRLYLIQYKKLLTT